MTIKSQEIREKFLEFFKEKNHAIIPSASLIPENDPTVLFNTAWMQPLVPYLLGERHPLGKRLADCQKCVRTGDLDEVGDNTHLTFFEMLGNWSLGDYFKKWSIEMSYELLTSPKWFAIDKKYLAVTVFEWDENAPRDEESASIWKSLWIPPERVSYMGADDNWWAAWPTWPCGPDTEIFYWVGEWEPSPDSNVKNDEKNWMEIWNNVFMEFNRLEDGKLINLPAQNVDTGMGLERITTTLNKKKSVYDTDIFEDILLKIQEIVGSENYNIRSARIIADHLRTATHMIADGVVPKNIDQGYILRRLVRRAIREFYKMGYEKAIISEIAEIYIKKFENIYESVKNNKEKIIDELNKEEERFGKTIKDWMRILEKKFESIVATWSLLVWEKESWWIDWKDVFDLFQTNWFPLEMTLEVLVDLSKQKWIDVDLDRITKEFDEEMKKHQELSRTASEGKFKWGLAGDGEMETKYHSATHILLAGLRKILGPHVYQAWSNITAERLRFDFTHGEKMTADQLQQVEDFVNQVIQSNAVMIMNEMKKDEAKAKWIVGSFWEKYPDIVKIYTLVWVDGVIYSQELCGWPHVETTENMGKFKIIKEEASSSWVRRIKAVLEK